MAGKFFSDKPSRLTHVGSNVCYKNGLRRQNSYSLSADNRDSPRNLLPHLDSDDNVGINPVRHGQQAGRSTEDEKRDCTVSGNSLAPLATGHTGERGSKYGSPLRVNKIPLTTFQLVPNRHTRNDNLFLLFKTIDDFYSPPLSRLNFNFFSFAYTPLPYFVWEVWFKEKRITFQAHVRADWSEYVKYKLSLVWPYVEILDSEPNLLPDSPQAYVWELVLKNHFVFPLNTRTRPENSLSLLFDTVKILENDDVAVLQVIIEPLGTLWKEKGSSCYHHLRIGTIPQRIEAKTPFYYFALFLHPVIHEIISIIGDFMGAKIESPNKQEFKPISPSYYNVLNKIKQPAFNVDIRVGAYAQKAFKAKTIAHSIVSFLDLLDGDNGFRMKPLYHGGVNKINSRSKNTLRLNPDILSASELSQIVLLPPYPLQQEYPEIDKVSKQEVILPKIVTSGGILIGYVKYRDVRQKVYLPVNNLDELCLPHIVIGGMGTGKTSFGANLAVEALKNSMGAIIIDPAKGEAGDEVSLVVPKWGIKRIKFGKEIICLDWREAMHSERGKNRFANEILSFFEVASDDIGLQTARYLRAAAKAVPNNKLKEIVELLLNPNYRKKLLPKMREQEKEVWENFNVLSDARQNQIIHPVLNRLDVIWGDDYLAECMEAQEGLDFVELLKEPKIIILDIPKRELGTEVVDILATLLITKINLAMVLRRTEFPVFVIQDEPHQYMRSYKIWKSAAVESRKWRFSFVWMFHAWEQLPRDLVSIIRAANPHYHIYTSSELTYRALAEEIRPIEIQEALNTPRHYAINVIRANGRTVTPFLAQMLPPPSKRI